MIPFIPVLGPSRVRGGAGVAKEVVERFSAASGSTSVYSKMEYSMSLLPLPLLTFEPTVKLVAIFPWFSLFFTLIAAVVLLKADKVTRAAAISSRVMRRSMFDDRFGCRLSGFMLAIDWQGCRAGVDSFFYLIEGGCCATLNEDDVPVL